MRNVFANKAPSGPRRPGTSRDNMILHQLAKKLGQSSIGCVVRGFLPDSHRLK
ncbi:hypothetical protein BDW72DRAFT_174631 [Aspergillus terricola var. indicus]